MDDAIKQRIDYMDIAKGIGMLLVIWRHCIINDNDQTPYFTTFIESFYMPLFFIISGYFYKIKPTRDYLYSRTKTLLTPLIIVYIYNYYSSFVAGIGGFDSKFLQFGGYWFFESLLYISLLYHFVHAFLLNVRIIKKEHIEFLLFIVSVIISSCALLINYLYGGMPSVNSAAVALIFFSFGIVYKKCENRINIKNNRIVYLIIGILIVIVTFALSQNLEDSSMAYNRCSNPIVFLVCGIIGSIGIIYISMAIDHSKFLVFVGKNTIPILFTQMPIILILRECIEFLSLKYFELSEFVKVCIIFVLIVGVEIPLTLLINKVFPIFSGKPKYEIN